MQVAICADVHFGVFNKLDDTLWAMRTMREYCAEANIDTIIIAGDLFHDRVSIGIEVLCAVANFFEEADLQYNQKWIVFPGNHDMFLRHSWGTNSLQALKKHLNVIDTVKILSIDDVRFWVLPFITYEKSYMSVLDKICQNYQEGDRLLTHIGVCGSVLNSCFLLKDWSIVSFDETPFKHVFTGHFHVHQKVGSNVIYPGSIIPFKFDEGNVKHGFLVHTLETGETKFVDIWKYGEKYFPDVTPAPQFITLNDNDIGQIDVNKFTSSNNISNAKVRVILNKDYPVNETNDIRSYLEKLGAKSVGWIHKVESNPNDIESVPQDIIEIDQFQALLEVDTNGWKGLDRNFLVTLNNDLVREGNEIYVVEEQDI